MVLLLTLALCSVAAFAQNTTISGRVYTPNGVDPLSNVLVYVVRTSAVPPGTGILAPLTSGATCTGANPSSQPGCMTEANALPTGVTIYTNSAVDGTFTLSDVPQDTYTLVIQAGKWRRQFYNVTVGSAGLTGQSYSMPSTHGDLSSPAGYGEIPKIAVVTGAVDSAECVLRDVGVSDSEFTDPTGSGRINFYTGQTNQSTNGGPGAEISASTQNESALVSSAAKLNGYDIVMFPCQGAGTDSAVNAGNSTNLKSYADAGGRIFATHYSYSWIDNTNTFQPSAGSGVANWNTGQTNPADGPGTINTTFSNGVTLGQWLYDVGGSTTLDQVSFTTVRHDLDGVIAPTQSWATLNSDSAIMQLTFNTPLGAAADSQFGRVLFNEYHVEDKSTNHTTGKIFPAECGTVLPPASMSGQEKMLEYSLFDLSTFVTGIVVPTVSITITPSPSSFSEGDVADTITVDVTNTSSTIALPSNTTLTVTLPSGIIATAMSDASGGWICTVGTLTCTRTTGLAAGASDSIDITVSVSSTATGGATSKTGTVSALVASPNFSSNVNAPVTITLNQHAAVTWATPAAITYGTALSSTQLNAVGNAAGNTTPNLNGTYVYSPVVGTVLSVGSYSLNVTYTPGAGYPSYPGSGTASVTLTVNQATPTISITNIPSGAMYSGSFTPTLTYTGDGTTSITSNSPSVCTVSGSQVDFVGVGTCSLTPGATAGTSYTAVTGSAQTFSVGKATANPTLGNLTPTYTGNPIAATVSTTPSNLASEVTLSAT